jgi:glycosyltransferase involved in cell wall biosynthesis
MTFVSRQPLVSVVIPTYNAPAYLKEALATVFAQTLDDLEVIVVNDGSTDDTAEHLARVQDPRLRVVTQENRGIGPARNRGIEEARGVYVAFLDHDDLWLPDKLRSQVEFMMGRPECVASVVPWALSSNPGQPVGPFRNLGLRRGVVADPLRFQTGQSTFRVTSALMVRRDALSGIRYATERGVIEDLSFQLQLLGRGEVGVSDDRILAIYRTHAANFSRNATFYTGGLNLLRRMERAGAFAEVDRRDADGRKRCFAGVAHLAVIFALRSGRRGLALRVWGTAAAGLLRWGHWKLVLAVPVMAVLPQRWINRRWHFEAV